MSFQIGYVGLTMGRFILTSMYQVNNELLCKHISNWERLRAYNAVLLYVSNTVFALLLIEYLIIFAEKRIPQSKELKYVLLLKSGINSWEYSIFLLPSGNILIFYYQTY